jgi:hypothetical protein
VAGKKESRPVINSLALDVFSQMYGNIGTSEGRNQALAFCFLLALHFGLKMCVESN